MNRNNNLNEVLRFYDVVCGKPYYISSGNPVFTFPKKTFRMDFYTICVCLTGTLTLKINNTEYTLHQNNFLISAPSTIVQFLNHSVDFSFKLLFFEKNFIVTNLANPFIIEKLGLFATTSYRIISPQEENALQIINLLLYLEKKTQMGGKFREGIVQSIIVNLLLEIAELAHTENELNQYTSINDNESVYYRFNELVYQSVNQHQDVQYYANKLCISTKHLIRVVKKVTGKTPHHIIDENLLKVACTLLADPKLNISEIAYGLNFSTPSSFGRFFKKYAHETPAGYRRQIQTND